MLGAAKLKGLDLASTAVVKAALAQEGAAVGAWLVDDRVAEVAVSAIRVGERPVALLVIGGPVEDSALASAAAAAGAHLSLWLEDKTVWSTTVLPAEAGLTAQPWNFRSGHQG